MIINNKKKNLFLCLVSASLDSGHRPLDGDGDEGEGGQGEEEIEIHVGVVLLRHQHLVDDPESCEGEGLGEADTSHNYVGIFSREKVERLQQSGRFQ